MFWKFQHFHTCAFLHCRHVNIKPIKWKCMQSGRDKQFLVCHTISRSRGRLWNPVKQPQLLSPLKDWARGAFCLTCTHHSFHLHSRRFFLYLLIIHPNHSGKTGKAGMSESLLLQYHKNITKCMDTYPHSIAVLMYPLLWGLSCLLTSRKCTSLELVLHLSSAGSYSLFPLLSLLIGKKKRKACNFASG